MKYYNAYIPALEPDVPRDAHANTPAWEYDLNFSGPVTRLGTRHVELRPFIVSLPPGANHDNNVAEILAPSIAIPICPSFS